MKYIIFSLLLIKSVPSLLSQTPADDPHWQLVWEDNFDTYNPDIWQKKHIFDSYGLSGALVYLEQNVTVNNGNLVLTIKEEGFSCPSWAIDPDWFCVRQYKTGLPYLYTSGWAETKQAYGTQFGYIEARVKVPFGFGFFPAFWVYINEGVPSPSNAAEIDIFEILGGTYPNPYTITTNYHLDYSGNKPHLAHNLTGFNYTDWHTYAIEWSPSKIIWYVDGFPIRTLPNHGIIDPVRITFNVSSQPDHPPIHSTPFPSEMLVDYVRVYELNKNHCNNDLSFCGADFNFFLALYSALDKSVFKSITLGTGSGCNNSLSSGHNIYLRASEGVIINGEFTVPVGAELYIDANACD